MCNIYFDANTYNLNQGGIEMFQKFNLSKIYHSDSESLISTLKEISNLGVDEWWSDELRVKTVIDFKNKYRLFNSNTLNLLVSFLKKL